MRERAEGSAWVPAAWQGVFFGAWMCGWWVFIDHDKWQHAVIIAVIIAPGYGLTMWWTSRGERQANATVLSGFSREQRRAVLRAAKSGKPPADVTLRAAAAELVRHRLARDAQTRTFSVVALAGFAVLSAVVALSGEWWDLAGTVMFGGATVWAWRFGNQLRRKLAALETPRSPAPPAKSRG